MTILYANPYNIDAKGFYFTSAGEFERKAEDLTDLHGSPVEEFEFDYIEGEDSQLFEACKINQTNLDTWFDDIESLDSQEKAALYYLTDCNGSDPDDALGSLDDVSLYEGSLLDAATELFDECYLSEVPQAIQNYIDYDAFARDCRLGGDMYEFEFGGSTWTVTNASEV
jgi:hypothetical protein